MREREDVFVSRRYDGWHRPVATKRRRRSPFLLITVLVIVLFVFVYGYIFFSNSGPSISSTKKSIQAVISSHPEYDIGVSLINIKTGEKFDVGKQTQFTAASTTKLLTAIFALQQVEKGNLSSRKTFNGYDLSWHIQQIISQSNDDSWVTLNHYFGEKKMEQFAKKVGILSYDYTANKISPNEVALLLQKLYNEELLNKSHTKQLLSYMQNTNDDSLIPAIADTTNITVFHKYGWYGSYIHDAAILKNVGSTWVLVVFTHPKNDKNSSDVSTEIIHSITKIVVSTMGSQN